MKISSTPFKIHKSKIYRICNRKVTLTRTLGVPCETDGELPFYWKTCGEVNLCVKDACNAMLWAKP